MEYLSIFSTLRETVLSVHLKFGVCLPTLRSRESNIDFFRGQLPLSKLETFSVLFETIKKLPLRHVDLIPTGVSPVHLYNLETMVN